MPDAPIAFFSYSREDSEFALRLANDLRAAGSAVWIDQLDIGPGERWDRVVQSALENCPSVLVILSPASVASNNVLDEVSFALDQNKTLIPVLYRECDIPFRLRRFQHLDFTGDYDRMIEELRKCLHIGQPAAVIPPAQPPLRAEPSEPPAPGAQRPQIAYPAPPVEPAPHYDATAPASPLRETDAKQASKFPKWVKIAIPVAAVLILVIVLMNLGSNSGGKGKNNESTQADGDMNSDAFGNPPPARSASTNSAQLVRSMLTTDKLPPPCRFPAGSGETEFSVASATVWYIFEFRGGKPDDQWEVTWFRGDKNHNYLNYLTQPLKNAAGGHGTYCHPLKVAGSEVQDMPGNWMVELDRNDEEVDKQEFVLKR